jgi:hypothetical protein
LEFWGEFVVFGGFLDHVGVEEGVEFGGLFDVVVEFLEG